MELRNEIPESPVKMKELKEIEKMFDKGAYGAVGQLCFLIDNNKCEIPGKIIGMIGQFPKVFEEPKGLSPPMSHEHNIPLTERVLPFKIRPYMHNFFSRK